ncbi:hypothetical protein FB451DRAFT_1188220 [Mycena latifolia]|nr:hypothetical protein FB451DRAFT_1188220 [Mycena latifolia]
MPSISISPPTCATDRLVRELVGPPLAQYNFDVDPCPEGGVHSFEMNYGHKKEAGWRLGTWQKICKNPYGEECPIQRAPNLYPKRVGEIRTLTTDFTPRMYAVDKLLDAVVKADDSMAVLYCLGDVPELPQEAAKRMAKKLNHARRLIEQMDNAYLPIPQNLELNVQDLSDKTHIYGDRSSGDDSSDEEDSLVEDEYFNFEDLPLIGGDPGGEINASFPGTLNINLLAGRQIRVVVYADYNKTGFHARLVPHLNSLDLSAYIDELPFDIGTPLVVFSVHTKKYEPVRGPVDLEGRGRILIFRKAGIPKCDCPAIAGWERSAVQSAEQDAKELGFDEDELDSLPPSSPPPPSSLLPPAPEALAAIASSSIKGKGKRAAESGSAQGAPGAKKAKGDIGSKTNPYVVDD